MKRTIVKIGKTGKRVAAILSFIIALFTIWGIYEKYSTKDITGLWHIEFTVISSTKKSYIGETHTQRVYFKQSESDIEGKGEKWDYNGKPLPYDQHRKLEYSGTIKGKVLKAVYVLHGLLRETEGAIEVVFDGDKLEGTFTGTAADSKGTVKGEKLKD